MRHAAALLLSALSLASCTPRPPIIAKAPTLALRQVRFADLPGWPLDHVAQALPPFLASCRAWAASPGRMFGGAGAAAVLGGHANQWRGACAAATDVGPGDDAARVFFENAFAPYAVRDGSTGDAHGLFTGYYEPEVAGSLTRDATAATPLLARPSDLVQVDLGAFSPDFKGRKIAGRVADGRLVPYPDRAAIVAGELGGAARPVAFLRDPIDAFVLQIQGSGRVRLSDGGVVRVTYDAENGQPYVPIGRLLLEQGEIPRDKISMQSIRAWLETHPDRAAALMDQNPSYVFFRRAAELRPQDGPPGAMGALLTPGRSIAVDPRFLPLGAPVFLATTDPLDGALFQRLMLAQDTGGAIRGPVRADVFWGWDADAANRAGLMRAHGTAYVLLPRPAP